MGNAQSIPRIHFEELQDKLSSVQQNDFCLINTMEETCQQCLIQHTIQISTEEETINQLLKKKQFKKQIILYGKNYHDPKVIKKYNQLTHLGFKDVRIFFGGMFEWLCLQEIYGKDLFPIKSSGVIDLLKYK